MRIWTVALVDRSEPSNEILWISVFSSKEKAIAFEEAAEQKLKAYGVYPQVDVVADECGVGGEAGLDLIDSRYGY